ncbi:hypothetical protein GR160_06460 [Flavobacterium sp. Sd200]|uniref:hypothetical protein n=1 Tax=Flavobacterium sp. Sd200 TaxID=2692211 RepID=UPI00136D279F|nr:hypothetical protein [Flavobacterium sp. Sd200]MXN90865.1 hypothetical protein [Flavobacterium sp. Sd200]
MKRYLFFMLAFLLFFAESSAQKRLYKDCSDCPNDENVLVYDFNCKHFYYNSKQVKSLKDIKVRYNEEFQIKIININRYLYDVKVSADDIVFSSEEPTLFKQFFLGNGFDFSKLNSNRDVENLPGSGGSEASTDGDTIQDNKSNKKIIIKIENDFIDAYVDFKDSYNTLIVNTIKANSICPVDVDCCESINFDEFKNLSEKLFDLRLKYSSLNAENNTLLEFETKQLEKHETALKQKEEGLKKESDLFDKEKDKVKKNNHKKNIDKINSEIAGLKEQIAVAEKSINDKKTLKKELDDFKAFLDNLTDEKMLELVYFSNNFVATNFEYTSPPIFAFGNELSLNIDITPSEVADSSPFKGLPLYSSELSVKLRVRNKWFYSFGTGPFVGIGSKLTSEQYGWQRQPVVETGTINESSGYKLVSTGNESAPVGIAGFANFGIKLSEFFGIGPSIGAGATINDDPQIAYFAGVSLFFGQDKQFNLTGGISFVRVKELKSELYNTLVSYVSTQDLEYRRPFKSGGFISLTYTVFDGKKSTNGSSGSAKSKASAKTPAAQTTENTETPQSESASGESDGDSGSATTSDDAIIIPATAISKDTKIKIKS